MASLHNAATLSRMHKLIDRAEARLTELADVAKLPADPTDAAELIVRLHDVSRTANTIAHVIAQASINASIAGDDNET